MAQKKPYDIITLCSGTHGKVTRKFYATCPLAGCCSLSVHDRGEILGLSKLLAMLLSRRVMLLFNRVIFV